MSTKRWRSGIVLLALLALPLSSQAAVWNIDSDHSSVAFKIQHLMVSNVKGNFQKVAGVIVSDEKDNTKTQVSVTIDVNSIYTGQSQRDAHLKSPDFFDAATYPTITFVSKKITKSVKAYKVVGDLTMHGVTKEVVLLSDAPSQEAKDPMGNTRRGIAASTKISRKDFGIVYNKALETGGVVIGDSVEISLDVEGVKAK